ncbi:tyrosine-type recombinase/integrase [Pseudidiomarina sp. 1APP75-32.1]|uniref:Tyrosine-type recombinase/integrase n=1 Tax=Pseudidiomarina terrestris TaxID=2820060 RepID=A0AAW7R1B6_9GAMM|nr:tyrosine-type recombinase/integrase [Pseudidiomarina sp. 1APP75-32.1]MDN7125064.1 tyrosine-type recombinase/integrase [Pseudidiomarina sp. 1APP75-32.1]
MTHFNGNLIDVMVLFLGERSQGLKRSTIQSELNRLKCIWQHASNLGHVPTDNPFLSQDIITPDTREENKTQLFEDDELSQVIGLVNKQPLEFKLIIKTLIFTGARPSEICSLTVDDFMEHQGVKVLRVKRGKTLAASRFIPLTSELANDLARFSSSLPTDTQLFHMDEKSVSRTFSRLKKQLVNDGRRKVLYSLRVHFSTAAQRAGLREDIAAQIVGHSNAKTLTFGYYSKGYEAPVVKENYDKIAKYIKDKWPVIIPLW